MVWKNKGKIQYNFPDKTGLNTSLDVKRIIYSRNGILADSKDIEKVYYISPAAETAISSKSTHEERIAELNKWLIWLRYSDSQRTLIAGDKNVAIEYIPDTDITVNSIEIFTTSDQGNTDKARIKILHESGLYIASFNGDGKSSNETLYELSGYKRYISSTSVTLYAGKKYYFVYNDSTNASTYYPAYFQNESGNYKEYSDNKDFVTTINISSFGTYYGELNDLASIFLQKENDFFYWKGDSSLISNSVCVRSNAGVGTTYKGELGSSTSSLRQQDVNDFINMSINDSFRLMSMNTGLSIGTLLYKSDNITDNTTDYGGQSSAALRLALLLMHINENDTTICSSAAANWEYGLNPADFLGHVFKMATGYSSQVTSLTPLDALPDSLVDNGLYFLKNGLISGLNSDSICLYKNGAWTIIYNYTDVNSYFNRTYITTYMTTIGSISDLYKQQISSEYSVSNTLRTAVIATPSRKYYLKLNNSIEV